MRANYLWRDVMWSSLYLYLIYLIVNMKNKLFYCVICKEKLIVLVLSLLFNNFFKDSNGNFIMKIEKNLGSIICFLSVFLKSLFRISFHSISPASLYAVLTAPVHLSCSFSCPVHSPKSPWFFPLFLFLSVSPVGTQLLCKIAFLSQNFAITAIFHTLVTFVDSAITFTPWCSGDDREFFPRKIHKIFG